MGLQAVIAGSFACAIIKRLVDTISSYAREQSNWELGMQGQLIKLNKTLHKIQTVLFTVEKGQIDGLNPGLQAWMWQLRDAAEEAEDVLDELEYFHLEEQVDTRDNKVHDTSTYLKQIISYAIQRDPKLKGLKECVRKLDEVAFDVEKFHELAKNQAALYKQRHKELMDSRVTGSLVSTGTVGVVGRDKEREKIVELLLKSNSASSSSCDNIHFLSIVGMGGVEKTTLAQYVYNDPRVENHFELRVWVCVSDVFEVTVVTRSILEGAIGSRASIDHLANLQKKLVHKLKSKRYLLIMDDIWNDKDRASWDKLFAALKMGKSGSKVLITTRLKTAKDVMPSMVETFHLEPLQEKDFWLLFKTCAFGGEDPRDHQKLLDIGLDIAKKLKGLPLAAKAVGGLLRSRLEDEYWASILEDINSYMEREEVNIMPILRLSYNQLPAHLQKCFAYCSIFPQDHKFYKNDIVYMWMGAGLVQQSKEERLEDIAGRYLDDLSTRSLLDMHEETVLLGFDANGINFDNNNIWYYTMHDLLHELAQNVSTGECLRIVDSELVQVPTTIRHLAIHTSSMDAIKKISVCTHLRTLVLSVFELEYEHLNDLEVELKKLKRLRVFQVSYDRSDVISLEFVGNMIHLRYLNLEHVQNKILPKSLVKLYHLQVLVAANNVAKVEGMKNLINLRHLISANNSQIYEIPRVGQLTALQELNSFFVQNCSDCMIGELGGMRELRKLSIRGLDNIMFAEEASEARLIEKMNLRSLSLIWDLQFPIEPVWAEQVLNHLEPHRILKKLNIERYRGVKSPFWMENLSLTDLEFICLKQCWNWETVPALGQLPYLRFLYLEDMCAARELSGRFHWDHEKDIILFPQLQDLRVKHMPALTEFWPGEERTHELTQWFPRLKKLHLKECRRLRRLPPQLCHSTTLQHLWIHGCPELEHHAAEEEGFRGLCSLKRLKLMQCSKLLVGSGHLLPSSLLSLSIKDCDLDDETLSGCLGGLTSLTRLSIKGSCNWADEELEGMQLTSLKLHHLASLGSLDVCQFKKMASLEGLQALPNLNNLLLSDLPRLSSIPPLPASLRFLALTRLSDLRSLPCLPISLGVLQIRECHEEFVERCTVLKGADWPNSAHIFRIDIFQNRY